MASYSIAAGERGAYEKTMVAATVDTVTFAITPRAVEIVSDGADEIYFTLDGSTPVAKAPATYFLPAFAGATRVVRTAQSSLVAKLISEGTPKYSISGVDDV